MTEPRDDRLQRDRRQLVRVLEDVQSGNIAGARPGELGALEDLIILRMSEIDRLLGEELNSGGAAEDCCSSKSAKSGSGAVDTIEAALAVINRC